MRANLKIVALVVGVFSMTAVHAGSTDYAQNVYKQATQSLTKDDKETLNRILNNMDAGQASPIDALQGVYTNVLSKDVKETLKIVKLSPTTAYVELAPLGAYIFGIADLQPDGSLLYQEDSPREGMSEEQANSEEQVKEDEKQVEEEAKEEGEGVLTEDEKMESRSIKRLYETAREHYWCKLGIHFAKDEIITTDPRDPQDVKDSPKYAEGTCTALHGSAKGGLDGVEFSRRTHRKLNAAQIGKMVQSEQFQRAMVWREMYLRGITPKAQ